MKKVSQKPIPEASLEVSTEEARAMLKESGGKVANGSVNSFVSLKDINKIYPNGVQAVYDFNIDIDKNDFIVLVGPSGCGKSTTLRMVAGLEAITSGYLYIDKVLANYLPSKERDISMVFQSYALYPNMTVYDNIAFPLKVRKFDKPVLAENVKAADEIMRCYFLEDKINPALIETFAEANDKNYRFSTAADYIATKMKIGDIATKYLVKFVKMSEAELLAQAEEVKAYAQGIKQQEMDKLAEQGLIIGENYQLIKDGEPQFRRAKLTKSEIRDKVFNAARVLDLGPYLDRRPNELSGGQMQRVALGRAVVRNAKLFLMDEPLSNLDAKLRVAMRSEIVRLHEAIGATTIYVTHDQTEAMTMATKIAVMSKGWVQQIGAPQEIYNNPSNIFVATFIGAPAMNIIKGVYEKGKIKFANGYEIALSKALKDKHDAFYKEGLEDVKRMLNTNDFKKLHAIKIFDEMHLEGADQEAKYNELKEVVLSIADDGEFKKLIDIVEAAKGNEKEYQKALKALKVALYDLKDISSSDLAKLHNASIFSSDKKKEDDGFVYDRRKHKKEKKKKVSFKVHNLTFQDNLYVSATALLEKYEFALKNPHEVNFGVRPEFIHIDKEFNSKTKSEAFEISADVVELMGQELLIHSNWNDVDLISKISTGTLVKHHEKVMVTFDMDKIHLFDTATGSKID